MKLPKINILISAIVFAVSIFAFIGFKFWQNNKSDAFEQNLKTEAEKLINQELPKAQFIEVETHKDVSSEIRSGDVLLVYLADGCEACKKELPILSQIQSKSGVRVFGIMPQNEYVIKNYVKANDLKFPVLIDKDAEIFRALNLKYTPTNLKLKNGFIQRALFGSPKSEAILLELTKTEVQ